MLPSLPVRTPEPGRVPWPGFPTSVMFPSGLAIGPACPPAHLRVTALYRQRLGPEVWPFSSASKTQQPFCCCRPRLLGRGQGLSRAGQQAGRGLRRLEGGSGTGSRLELWGRSRAQGPVRAALGPGIRRLGSCGANSWQRGFPGEQRTCGPQSGHVRKEARVLEGAHF